eukprot:366459-Chlamydomonas_euryale.AAC.4
MDGAVLDDAALRRADVVFVTMTAPPKVPTLPGKDSLNRAAQCRLDVLHARRRAEANAATSEAHAAEKRRCGAAGGARAGAAGGAQYVPAALRAKRAGEYQKHNGSPSAAHEEWVVPVFNSERGFERGVEADNGIIYFD